jgi:hypothetical protein
VLAAGDGVQVPGVTDGLYTGRAEGQAEPLVMRVTWNAEAKAYEALTQDDPNAVPMWLRAKPVAGPDYLLQAEPKDSQAGDDGIAVLLVRVNGPSVALVAAEAEETRRVAAAAGVTVGEFGELAGSAPQIEAFVKALAADPAAKVAATFTRTGD